MFWLTGSRHTRLGTSLNTCKRGFDMSSVCSSSRQRIITMIPSLVLTNPMSRCTALPVSLESICGKSTASVVIYKHPQEARFQGSLLGKQNHSMLSRHVLFRASGGKISCLYGKSGCVTSRKSPSLKLKSYLCDRVSRIRARFFFAVFFLYIAVSFIIIVQ